MKTRVAFYRDKDGARNRLKALSYFREAEDGILSSEEAWEPHSPRLLSFPYIFLSILPLFFRLEKNSRDRDELPGTKYRRMGYHLSTWPERERIREREREGENERARTPGD